MEIQQSDLLNTLNQAAQSQLIFVNFHFVCSLQIASSQVSKQVRLNSSLFILTDYYVVIDKGIAKTRDSCLFL